MPAAPLHMGLRSSVLFSAVAAAAGMAPTVRLRNGVGMPMLAAGTWQYNDSDAEASVVAALRAGFRMVDTAWDYHNQAGVGRGVRRSGLPREHVFVETKVPGCGLDKFVGIFHCYNDTVRALYRDLELLGMDYVDLVILHFPPVGAVVARTCGVVCGEVRDQWRALEEFYAAGKAKAIGVSNYCPSCFSCLDDTAKVYPMVNQISYHVGMGPDPAGFRSFADKHGVMLQAYSPLANNPFRRSPDPEIIAGNLTKSLARAHNKSTIQVALKYLVQHGVPVVTKSRSPAHLAEDLDLWSWELTSDELAAADMLQIRGRPSFACNTAESFAADMPHEAAAIFV